MQIYFVKHYPASLFRTILNNNWMTIVKLLDVRLLLHHLVRNDILGI